MIWAISYGLYGNPIYSATTVGNTVYIVGGSDTFFEDGNKIYQFNHIWAITPGNLQTGRHGHSAIYHNGLILIVGGPGKWVLKIILNEVGDIFKHANRDMESEW